MQTDLKIRISLLQASDSNIVFTEPIENNPALSYAPAMSLAEILDEIPKLSFAERQELVRRAIAVDETDLTAEESAILDTRMEDFRRDPEAGVPLEEVKDQILKHLPRR